MPIVANSKLYEEVKKEANKIYDKPSAFKSGWIIKTYKSRGGEYLDDKKPRNLKRWFKEDWKDVNPFKTEHSYPVFRPTKRISKKTPLTIEEIDPKNLIKQSILKQKYKGLRNLPPFIYKE